ncbi:chaplin [Streptomyces poriticola]|uniref:chaplin n=1 Tax=Streptomyces poriticola TaxID=3120506 RepID=UPI002FCE4A81
MRRVTRYGVLAVAASGAMAVTVPASAHVSGGAAADGTAAGSPGLISGNTVQLPVHLPVNVCGNTVNVAGLLNPAAGNGCAATGRADREGDRARDDGAGGPASSGTAAAGSRGKDSPGVLSGNGVQLPVRLPVNVSGNSVNVVGVGTPATGNQSVNGPGERPSRPQRPAEPAPQPPAPPADRPMPAPEEARPPTGALAHTGTDAMLPALAGGVAFVLGGAVLHRRFRPGANA